MMAALPGLLGLGFEMFGGGGSDANDYLAQQRAEQQRMLQPFVNAGQAAIPTLQSQYQNLLNAPGNVYSGFGAGYQQSPRYKYNLGETERAMGNAASAGGYVGSPQHQMQMGRAASDLSGRDIDQYINSVMGLYGQGLQGQQGMMGAGLGAATGSMQSLNDMLRSQAELAHQNQLNRGRGMGALGAGLGYGLGQYGKTQGWGNEGNWGYGLF